MRLTIVIQSIISLLIVVLIYLSLRARRRDEFQRSEALEKILSAIDVRSSRVVTASGTSVARVEHIAEFSSQIQQSVSLLNDTIRRSLDELTNLQREHLSQDRNNLELFNHLLQNIARQKEALEHIAHLLEASKSSPPHPPDNDRVRVRKSEPIVPAAAVTMVEKADSTDADNRFEKLASWLESNLHRVLQRSLIDHSDAAALLLGVPNELAATAEILDGVVLLVGVKDYDQRLAAVLPGSYIGSRYYNWFDIPRGTNERVEDTAQPAVVKQIDNDFAVLKRGVVHQN